MIRYNLQYFGGRGASSGAGGSAGTYKGYDIDKFGDGYTVLYQGDEVYADSLKDARDFIDGARVHEAYYAIEHSREPLKELAHYSDEMKVNKPTLTENGNSIKQQVATLDNGTEKIDLAFSTKYNPMQTTGTPSKPIESKITATLWENGDAKAIVTLSKTSSKSYKNAEKQYNEMLNEWKKVTGQKKITFS